MSCQSSYVQTCPVGSFPWAAVDEELDILRRSRSEITESLCSSSGRELDDGGEGGVEEGGVGKTSFVCDVAGRWFCKTPVQLAENLRLLRRRWGAGRDWDGGSGVRVRCAGRGLAGAIIEAFLSSARSRGC